MPYLTRAFTFTCKFLKCCLSRSQSKTQKFSELLKTKTAEFYINNKWFQSNCFKKSQNKNFILTKYPQYHFSISIQYFAYLSNGFDTIRSYLAVHNSRQKHLHVYSSIIKHGRQKVHNLFSLLICKSLIWFTEKNFFKIIICFFNTSKFFKNNVISFEAYVGFIYPKILKL